MTAVVPDPSPSRKSGGARTPVRIATPRRYLMCPPEHFTVELRDQPVDGPGRSRPTPASRRAPVGGARRTYLELGHERRADRPVDGLPDMVYAANGGIVIDGIALRRPVPLPGARRRGRRRTWAGSAADGFEVARAGEVNEGEGDFLSSATRSSPAPASAPTRAPPRGRPSLRPRGRLAASSSTRASTTSTPRSPCSTTRPTHRLPPEAFSPAQPRDPAPSGSPTPSIADDGGRRGPRPQRRLSDGRHVVLPAARQGLRPRSGRARLRPGPRRPVRAAQGRRRLEVLHAGAALDDRASDLAAIDRRRDGIGTRS